MISVQNRLQLLSGNRVIAILFFSLLLASCSPKIVAVRPKGETKPVKDKPKVSEPVKDAHSIALLLPFQLNKINPETASRKEISKADMAIDFYQGFKLALDSLSAQGYDFKLQVYDTQDHETRVVNLARANSVRSNDLIVGPVFPDEIKAFGDFFELKIKLQVSPLAASLPSQFNNPNLVTVTNTIDQHGWKVADHINKNYKPAGVNVILLNAKKAEDEKFAVPVQKYLKELSGNKFAVTERPNSAAIETYLDPSKNNLVIITSSEKDFLLPAIDKLYKLSQQNYKIELFGHPNWVKSQFLNSEKMQMLNTHITSSYYVNYKASNVKQFISRYRAAYGLEPSDFAFKGFDNGYYFGKLLARYGTDYIDHLTDETYEGLHNSFHFSRDSKVGFKNTDLMMLQYRGFELQVIR